MDDVATLKTCAQCGTAVAPVDGVNTGDRTFCRTCYDQLQWEIRDRVHQDGKDIPYGKALVGAMLGGAVGAVVWWGFTVLTKVALGLIAIAIGYLVGQGAVRFSGGKKSRQLQILSVSVALVSILVATYLVNMTFINEALAKQGNADRLSIPPNPGVFFRVIAMNFGIMDLVFIAITLFQAWKIPAPLAIPPPKIA